MKKIGILIAINRESDSFFKEFDSSKEEIVLNNYHVYKYLINNNEVYVVTSQCGNIRSAAALELLICNFKIEYVINFGVVGALDKNIHVSDLFLIKNVVHYDFDTSSCSTDMKKHQYSMFKDEYIPFDVDLINFVKKIDSTLKVVNCASGDKFIADRAIKTKLHNECNCDICDMESAGIGLISYINNVKALSIKCISDEFDGDGKDFDKNVSEASRKATILLKKILFKL
ncbi:MAG: 5'-methylthioadenosine/S-adenosylhomocysteine nucleosidase [Bacilli bacterium]